jgi:GntR family transcriptional regulator/MocR family aminotransferase
MAEELGVSTTTITAAFSLLRERGLIRPEVGRGTFVSERPSAYLRTQRVTPGAIAVPLSRREKMPWRRRVLMGSTARLRTAYPHASDCSTGRPDINLLPFDIIKRAWHATMEASTPVDLQYAGPDPIEPLTLALSPLLAKDGIEATARNLVIGSSAQQLMSLCLESVGGLSGSEKSVVAIEEPGYPTIMDTYERAGARLIGIAVDEYGAIPDALAAALEGGATLVLLTPRAHNPTGASWSSARLSAIADVLAAHPGSIIIEDDQFADIATTRPGSLLTDERIAERVVYIRSFSKSIGPDLRMAVAVARPRLRDLIVEAKGHADGWSSRLLQRTLTAVLVDPELGPVLARARDAYRNRREVAAEALNTALRGYDGGAWCGPDGVNLWVRLPHGVDSAEVAEHAAAFGVLVAQGEGFFIRPGRNDVVRLNAGSVPAEVARRCGGLLAQAAIQALASQRSGIIHV